MLPAEKAKITQFLNDKLLSETIFKVLRSIYTRKTAVNDVQTLAAERIAINLLEDALRELKSLQFIEERQDTRPTNPGI